ncbi:MAG: hypothetical protein AAB582_01830 [Patescibacteria group bacterium]
MKITIIGPTGGGKSTLARRISQKFSIPHVELDRFWFESGGKLKQTDEERAHVAHEIRNKITPLLLEDNWVCDGTYARIQPEIAKMADQVVLIDISFLERIGNHFTRLRTRADRHPEVTLLSDILYFGEIAKRQFTSQKKVQDLATAHADKLVRLRRRKEIDRYFQSLG